MYIYAVLGVGLFAGIEDISPTSSQNPSHTFDTLGGAFLILFQMLVGESWQDIMYV